MTHEDRELLLKDLGGRLPYGVKILDIPANVVGKLFLISTTDTVQYETADDTGIQTLYNIKPYLFPLSSISNKTLEMFDEWADSKTSRVIMEFYNSRHIDYSGLIEKGLAIDATGLNIY